MFYKQNVLLIDFYFAKICATALYLFDKNVITIILLLRFFSKHAVFPRKLNYFASSRTKKVFEYKIWLRNKFKYYCCLNDTEQLPFG